LQQQLLQSIQALDQNTLPSVGLNGLFQSLQQQTPQASSTPILSAQLLSDALKMIAPVGQSPNDEQLLVMAGVCLCLHVPSLSLENKSRIDEMVDQLQPIKTAKKPVRFDLVSKALSVPSKFEGKAKERSADERHLSYPLEPGSSSQKNTSPLTPRIREHRGLFRHSDWPIPPPPESEPIPPTKVVKSFRGNLYTVEDKKYFAKYISWALRDNPLLGKGELIAKLAENVPHHTASSWISYWSRDPLADRLLAAARERENGDDQDQGFIEDAEEEDYIENDKESVEQGSLHDSDEDEAAMGGHGSVFGAAEFRVMAKYIARHDPEEWVMMTSKQRWFPFHEEHPHRSHKAYCERYRIKEQELLSLAERYRTRAQRQMEKQRATPSWANAGVRKRRLSSHESPSKRVRELE